MDSRGPYGSPTAVPPPPPPPGGNSTVKAAVALTMLVVVLALVEAVLAVYMQREIRADTQDDDLAALKIMFGTLIGINLVLAAGLGGGAVLTLRRSVAGKVLIWVFGSLSALMRCACGGISGLTLYLYLAGEFDGDDSYPRGTFTALLIIEVVALVCILGAMILLMTRAASFRGPVPPPPAYGSPAVPPGSPAGPSRPGWPA